MAAGICGCFFLFLARDRGDIYLSSFGKQKGEIGKGVEAAEKEKKAASGKRRRQRRQTEKCRKTGNENAFGEVSQSGWANGKRAIVSQKKRSAKSIPKPSVPKAVESKVARARSVPKAVANGVFCSTEQVGLVEYEWPPWWKRNRLCAGGLDRSWDGTQGGGSGKAEEEEREEKSEK